MKENKNKKALDSLVRNIEKKWGKDLIMPLNYSNEVNKKFEVISSGCLSIDRITGINGFPRGRMIEVYGPESGGKTTLSLHVIAEAQKDGMAAFIDVEHSLDLEYAKKIGVSIDNNKLMFAQPDTGEKALNLVIELLKSKLFTVIVIDSIAGLVPEAEFENGMEKQQMGLQARLMGKAMRKMVHYAKQSNTLLLFINQIRDKMGVMWGDKTTTPGGHALKFMASMRIFITKIQKIKGAKGRIIANRTKVIVKKNKCSSPFRECEFSIVYGEGIDKIEDVVNILLIGKVIKKRKDGYELGKYKFNDINELCEKAEKNSKLFDKLKKIAEKVEI